MSFTVDQLARNHQVASAANFAGSSDLVGAGEFTITVGGSDHTITTTADTTLSELAAEVNGLDSGVSATVISVDGTNYKLLLSSDDTGLGGSFTTSGTVGSLSTMDIVQQGQDAEITIGSGATALTLSRATNTITDLVEGVSIELTQTTTAAVTVSTKRDVTAAIDSIKGLMDEVNAALTTIADLTKYSPEAETGGPLVGNSTARALELDLRSAISSFVNAQSGDYRMASSVGISLNREGTFDVDEAKLRTALEDDFDAVVGMLVEGGSAADSRLGYIAAGTATVVGDYEVVVTQAATKASALSDIYKKPNSDVTFQIIAGTTTVDVSVLRNDPIETVVQAINDALDAAGVTSIEATLVQQGADGFIQLDHGGYGSAASFQVVGDPFGLAGTYAGADVAGTIGGEAATGNVGHILPNSLAPLIVQVTATAAEVSGAGGSLSLGNISYTRGAFGSLDITIGDAEGSGGRIARARDLTAAQIDLIDDRIEVLEDRIDRREAMLIRQYAALETAMATLTSQSQWLASQLAALNGGGQT